MIRPTLPVEMEGGSLLIVLCKNPMLKSHIFIVSSSFMLLEFSNSWIEIETKEGFWDFGGFMDFG